MLEDDRKKEIGRWQDFFHKQVCRTLVMSVKQTELRVVRTMNRVFGSRLHCLVGRYFSSLLTVSGENAGRHTAMYSAPSGDGLLYCTHSPARTATA